MAASIWSMGWRAGTASLDPSILDKKKSVGRGRLICSACITDMMSCTDSAAQTVNFDLRFYNMLITKSGEVSQQDAILHHIQSI